jgi:hypothetical protein
MGERPIKVEEWELVTLKDKNDIFHFINNIQHGSFSPPAPPYNAQELP